MAVSDSLRNIENNYPLNTIGLIISVFFGIIGIIIGIFSMLQERPTDISFRIISEANVLDVRKPLQELSIFFQGKDIQKNNLNLRIITIQIENTGQQDILQTFYDSKDIWGFKVNNGKLVGLRLINSNSQYLLRQLKPIATSTVVKFDKVIFERGKYFTIEILILHEKNRLPEIIPLGKIAGIDKIVPIKVWATGKKGALSQAFTGDFLIQLIRLLGYFIFFVMSVGLIAFLIIKRQDYKDKKFVEFYKKHIESFLDFKSLTRAEYDLLIFLCIRTKDGINNVQNLLRLLQDRDELSNYYEQIEDKWDTTEKGTFNIHNFNEFNIDYHKDIPIAPIVQYLVNNEIVKIINDRLVPKPDFVRIVHELLDYLVKK